MFKILFIFFFLYVCFNLVARYVLPFVIRNFVNRTLNNQFGQDSRKMRNERTQQKEKKQEKQKDDLGEYIDYEEVK